MKVLRFLFIIGTLTSHGATSRDSERIVTGRNCTKEESTYLASISISTDNICGGSFLAPKWVLTAAHCCEEFLSRGITSCKVLAGMTEWQKDVEQTSDIDQFFMPHSYKNFPTNNTLGPVTDDVCLLKLKVSINPSKRVKFSKLVTTEEFKEMRQKGKCSQVLAMGHGSQVQRPFGQPVNPFLLAHPNLRTQCLDMEMLGRKVCQDNRTIMGQVSETAFCVKKNIGGICQGDSGGPLYCQGIQIGVCSTAFGCADTRYPDVYARVDLHISYFEEVMGIKAETSKVANSSGTYSIDYYKILLCIVLCNIILRAK